MNLETEILFADDMRSSRWNNPRTPVRIYSIQQFSDRIQSFEAFFERLQFEVQVSAF